MALNRSLRPWFPFRITELEEAQSALATAVAEAENRAQVQAQIAEKRRQDVALADSRVQLANNELNDYKQKAQRILQSKEKLIATLKASRLAGVDGDGAAGSAASESMEMEQLRQERDLLRDETGKQQAALEMLKGDTLFLVLKIQLVLFCQTF